MLESEKKPGFVAPAHISVASDEQAEDCIEVEEEKVVV